MLLNLRHLRLKRQSSNSFSPPERFTEMPNDDFPNVPHGQALVRALEVLEAIGEAGLAVVPVEPTDAMVEALARAAGIERPAARKIYRALLKAAE